ncbi:MAG: hopanoid biosynthesis associated radical SAM protein HpnJ [Planctomycetes bacterium]|nr:hopanoid biosynthesis associated radical SAM protein HpnJ [Planctomycetota bacterium]
MRTLFLNPPSFGGFDGGAGSRYQARREIRSFWYPTWLAYPAGLVSESRLLDAPPADMTVEDVVCSARGYDLIIIHTSTPSLHNDARVAERLKDEFPGVTIGFVGPHAMVLPQETLAASSSIDFVVKGEFDYAVAEVASGLPLEKVDGLAYRKNGRTEFTAHRPVIEDLDRLPFVTDVYARDLKIENYFIGYLQHPYLSLYTGRGCKSRCTFCLWPQTIGGHVYRVRSPQNVYEELARAKEIFPQVKEFFFDDDTFTDNLPRAEEIARKLGTLGITWSCNAKANVPYETLKVMKENGLRLLLVGFESGNQKILNGIKKGVRADWAREFVKNTEDLGILIHGTFIVGLPGETRETIEETIQFAKEIDVYSIQVSLAAPYPGTALYEQAVREGWIVQGENLVRDGIQDAVLSYKDLDRDEIFRSVERFYRKFYFRPKPILRIFRDMMKDKQVFKRRIREGVEFFSFMAKRR